MLSAPASLSLLALLFSVSLFSSPASAFSLGIRPNAGMELLTLPGVQLKRDDDQTFATKNGVIGRNFLFFGGDLSITPIEFGKMSVSALVGFRTTSTKATGAFNDEISFSYVPVGASFDYALGKIRTSAYFSYDLGMSPKLKLSVDATQSSLDAKISSLSRLRFGALGEFFVMPSLSVFAQGDFAMGGYKNEAGALILADLDGGGVPTTFQPNNNKLSGLTMGAGVSYYLSTPASQRTASAKGNKVVPGKKSVKPGAKKAKPMPMPKPKAPPAGG